MRRALGSIFASLGARLVVTVVALVVLVAVLIGAAATAALDAQLNRQIDRDLERSDGRLVTGQGTQPPPSEGTEEEGDHDGEFDPRGRGPESVVAQFASDVSRGTVFGFQEETELSAAQLAVLADVPVDGRVHEVTLPGLGSYRAVARTDGRYVLVNGLPTRQADQAVAALVGWEALLIGVGALVALAAGLVLVRRQLRPLRQVAATAHEVAALPLAEGDISLEQRVPESLTDERTEVGQVGAALNTLLEHVESSLSARHRSEQQVRQFVADASHELRTPLATIAGYTELARRRPDDDPDLTVVRTALGKVEEESARMTSLVEDLLLLARLDAGRPLERGPVDLTRLLVEAVDDARVVGPDHRWRLELPGSPDGELPVEVTGDEQRLHQVITNLLTNARKHTPPGTTVTVTVRADGFDVHDDGPGFPADFVDHAFERFARVDQARERSGGAGLGLSLVEAIIRSHEGTVTLQSAPGGTTVAVRLP